MSSLDALVNGKLLIDQGIVAGRAVLMETARIRGVVPDHEVPRGARRVDLAGGLLAPGFVDLQVNGGGGTLFNAAPTVETIALIGSTHRRFGTTGFVPTLITTDRATMRRAVAAVRAAIEQRVPGVLGIHLEGPHLNPARAGVHDPRQIRPVADGDIGLLGSLGAGRTLVTLAPEAVGRRDIEALTARGIVVSAGHTEAGPEQLGGAVAAGLSGVTHLFNAMAQLGARTPGAVGAALTHDGCACGIIVDGRHVHPASVRIAWRAKPRGGLFLVTDAMAPVGTDMDHFALDGRRIDVRDGCCTTADGRLAGSTLDMAGAVANAVHLAGIPLDEALRMASTWPAGFLGVADQRGRIAPGAFADLVLLDDDLRVRATWIEGDVMWADEAAP